MKNLLKLSVGSTLLLVVASLSIGESARAFNTLGFSISLSQRDVRLFNNFDDSLSNDNHVIHPNWPGYSRAYLAIWKAAYEWGVDAFGDGAGDSTQSNIGDGGANFTPVWNGKASGSGTGMQNNIVHAPNVDGGGFIAWAYVGPSGWLIEFADNSFDFADGPDTISWPEMDIQGVASHEYGHALGLAHATAPSATMYPTIQAGSVEERSITTDDSSGVQYIYGAKDSGMPYIDGILGSTVPGGTAVLLGGNFTPNDCRLWFNSDVYDSTDSGGELFKLQGLSSTGNGTQIPFTVPSSGIETGAIHAKVNGGKGSLSGGHPFPLGIPSISNTLTLVGPSTAAAGKSVMFSFGDARPQVYFEIGWSPSLNGHKINGHFFDLGRRVRTVISGITTSSGAGWGSKKIPLHAVGMTVYLEALTLDGGFYEDSNPLRLDIL